MPLPASFALSLTAPCLRPLPSAGITRLPQYYGPLRHPARPGLSLTGFRLARATPPSGLPVLPRLPSSMHADTTTPAGTARCLCRFASRPVVGLPLISGGSAPALPFSRPARCSRNVPACMVAELLTQPFVTGVLQSTSLPPCPAPAATNRKRQLLGGIRTHQENAPFHGALRYPG